MTEATGDRGLGQPSDAFRRALAKSHKGLCSFQHQVFEKPRHGQVPPSTQSRYRSLLVPKGGYCVAQRSDSLQPADFGPVPQWYIHGMDGIKRNYSQVERGLLIVELTSRSRKHARKRVHNCILRFIVRLHALYCTTQAHEEKETPLGHCGRRLRLSEKCSSK